MKVFSSVLSALFVVVLYVPSIAQKDYKPAYIVTSVNDTIDGYINYQNWKRNPRKIRFKKAENSKAQAYGIDQLLAFEVGGDVYQKYIINTEASSLAIDYLDTKKEPLLRKDTGFVRAILLGEKSLYEYIDRGDKTNFYIEEADTLTLLGYKKYREEGPMGENFIKENNSYKGQLAYYFRDCFDLQPKINKTTYKLNSLKSLFTEYYKCSGDTPSFKGKTGKVSIGSGILLGISRTELNFSSSYGNSILTELDYDPSTNIAIGCFVNFVLPRANKKWSIVNELLYHSFAMQEENTSFDFAYLKLNNLLRYSYPVNENLRFHINAGISNGIAIKSDYDIAPFSTPLQRKHEQSYVFGIGTKYKNWSIDARYERGNGMSEAVIYKSEVSRLYCIIGYQLEKK
ncbi:MAG: PorT family protein [Chitinophagales bacterium]|nr:PorT family protein [Chitinophagales bacterium]